MAAFSSAALMIASSMLVELEGVEYQPYYDVGGVLTVCYGHTGNDIEQDKTYTQLECEDLLEQDLQRIAKNVDPLIKVEISIAKRAALYSFAYNVGGTAFARSTLLKKLNAGDLNGACEQMKRWVFADGKKWRGLMNRREVEQAVCGYARST